MTKQKTGTSLRDQLIGAWKLVSYVEEPIDPPSRKDYGATGGSAPDYPFGEDAQGIIMYTPDGFMSAQRFAGRELYGGRL